MKKLHYLVVILLTFSVFIGCNRDDKDENSIVGTWGLTSVTVKGTLKKDNQSIPVNQTQNSDACTAKSTTTFKADGTGNTEGYAPDSSGNCQLTVNEPLTYSYNASTKSLTLTVDGLQQVMTLETLTATTLSYGESVTDLDFGVYEPGLEGYKFTGTITLNATKK